VIGYPAREAALATSLRHMRTERRAAALQLEDGSWAAGLGGVCGEEHRARSVLLPDGRAERLEYADGTWRVVDRGPGPSVHWIERDTSRPLWLRVPIEQRVQLRYAIELTWRRPSGRGPWLVVERGVSSMQASALEGISNAGVIVRRSRSEAGAQEHRHGLAAEALARHTLGARYEVVHEAAVDVMESSQPYGCNAADRMLTEVQS
jgi:hypothetical protein